MAYIQQNAADHADVYRRQSGWYGGRSEDNDDRNFSCDLLVGLTHLGVDLDSTLAEQMPQLRLIVGGHSHTVLAGGGKSVNGVLITQTGKGLQYAGITRLKFRNRRLIGIENHLVPLDTISPDPKIAALVRQYEQAPELLRRVGETTVPMDKVALLNLQVDAILARTQTDFAFYNWNGMRIDTHAAAPFTVADVFAMEPSAACYTSCR